MIKTYRWSFQLNPCTVLWQLVLRVIEQLNRHWLPASVIVIFAFLAYTLALLMPMHTPSYKVNCFCCKRVLLKTHNSLIAPLGVRLRFCVQCNIIFFLPLCSLLIIANAWGFMHCLMAVLYSNVHEYIRRSIMQFWSRILLFSNYKSTFFCNSQPGRNISYDILISL